MTKFNTALSGLLTAAFVSTATLASAQTARAPAETWIGESATYGYAVQGQPDRTRFGSGQATTVHRTARLGIEPAPRIGISPSAPASSHNATTVHDTQRRADISPAPRVGVRPSAPD